MSVFLYSENVSQTTGNGKRYDGVWSLNSYIQGQYRVIEQWIDTTAIPWILEGASNELDVEYGGETSNWNLFDVISEINTITDLETVRAAIDAAFQAICAHYDNEITCTVTLDDTNENFDINFNLPVTIFYSTMEMRYIFNTPTEDTTDRHHIWSTINIDTSPHLFLTVPEISSTIIEKDNLSSALIFHTADNPLTGMYITIREPTNQLTISIFRRSIPNEPCSLKNIWYLILLFVNQI